jgi:uncharacterized phage infection (PIP) family protein YhgE
MKNQLSQAAAELQELEAKLVQIDEQVQNAQTAADDAREYLLAADASKGATDRASKAAATLSALQDAKAELEKRIAAKRSKLDELQAIERDAEKFENLSAKMREMSDLKSGELKLWKEASDAALLAVQKLHEHQLRADKAASEMQTAFDAIAGNVSRKLIYSAPDDDAQDKTRALLDKLKAADVDLRGLASDDDRNWLSGKVPQRDWSHQQLPLYFFLQDVLDSFDGSAQAQHGAAHSEAVTVGGPLTPPATTSAQTPSATPPETLPETPKQLFTNGARDYAKEIETYGRIAPSEPEG